jgi:predicted transcriptional regulator
VLSPFGELSLFLLSSIDFASHHRDYFTEHDISRIPPEFVERIGELNEGEHMPEALKNINEGERRMREAKELVWILSDQVLASSIPTLAEKVKAPFNLRIMLPEGTFPPEGESKLPITTLGIQKRVLPKVDVLIVMTEKYAVFCLPNRNGKIDYTGFTGTTPKFRKWCKDLYLHYWDTAKPIGTES